MKTLKRSIVSKMLPVTMAISVITCLTLLSSCYATIRTPRHERSGVVIESHDNGNHYGQHKRGHDYQH